jgi:hypothetical protein
MDLNSEVYRYGKIVNKNLKINQNDKMYYLQDNYLKQRPRFFGVTKNSSKEIQEFERELEKKLVQTFLI